jgi:hypothetical protein
MVKVGDFINLRNWFSDVWAEVVHVGDGSVQFCQYNKGGNERWLEHSFFPTRDIRKVAAADSPEVRSAWRGGILYAASSYRGGFGQQAEWPTPLTAESPFSNNRRERNDAAITHRRFGE